jgi:hypothetical protein
LAISPRRRRGASTRLCLLARSTDFDVAILDVNPDGKIITPVAQLIEGRGLPIIFATSYGAAGVPEEFRDRLALQKPFELKPLEAALNSIPTDLAS